VKLNFLIFIAIIAAFQPNYSQDYEFWAWGLNSSKQINETKVKSFTTPFPLAIYSSTKHSYKSISLGETFTLYVKEDGSLWGWGSNSTGQLGDGTLEDKPNPIQIGTSLEWVNVVCSKYENYEYAVGLKKNGSIWAWGNNYFGQLGRGSINDLSTLPLRIGNSNDWQDVSTAYGHSVAIKKDGTIWAWGFNIFGQLGNGNKTDMTVPTQIGTENNWTMITAGKYHTSALNKNGTIWTWGKNNYGQLGIGNYIDMSIPKQIGLDTNWIYVNSGNDFSLAINNKGQLFSWGLNNFGQLGIGDTLFISTPNKVDDNEWLIIKTGGLHTVGINIDGNVYTWGYNKYGQLGDGTIENSSKPKLVLNGNNWNNVHPGGNNTIAVKGVIKLSATITGKFFYLPNQNVKNIVIDINGKFKKIIYSDVNGKFYSLKLPNGIYKITPLPSNDFTFYPTSRTIEVKGEDINIGIDFNIEEKRSEALGYVKNIDNFSIPNISLKLNGKSDTIVNTDSAGYFKFSNLLKGNYTLKPVTNLNFTFNPDSINFSIDGSNISTGLDFIANENYGNIYGKVQDEFNNPLKDLDVFLTAFVNKSTKTIEDGTYMFSNLVDGEFIISPQKISLKEFSPSSRTVTIKNNNVFNVDFKSYSSSYNTGIIEVSDATFEQYDIKSNNFEFKDIVIKNLSNTDNLVITGFRNSNPNIFETNLPNQSSQLNLNIKPNGILQFQTIFKPSEKKKYLDSIIFNSNAKTIDSIAYLSGEGIDTVINSVEFIEIENSLMQSNEIILFDLTGGKIATYLNYNSFKVDKNLLKLPILIRWRDEKGIYNFQKLK